jgi:hypothetical protein
MNQTITISEAVYARLEAWAQQQGLSLEELLRELSLDQEAQGNLLTMGEAELAQLVALHEATFPGAREATSAERASVGNAMRQKVRQRLRLSELLAPSGSEEPVDAHSG